VQIVGDLDRFVKLREAVNAGEGPNTSSRDTFELAEGCNRTELLAAERRCGSRLRDHRAAGGDRWCHLVHDQVQGMIEGRDRDDNTNRLLGRKGPSPR
jgi:hypothetical protein